MASVKKRMSIALVSAMLAVAMPCEVLSADGGTPGDDDVVVLIDEDFNGATEGEPDNVTYTGSIDDITATEGWTTTAMGSSKGVYVFAPTIAAVTLTTPPLQIGRNAPLKLSLTMAEYNNERYYTDGDVTISMITTDGSVAGSMGVDLTYAGYKQYDVEFAAPLPDAVERVMISYDNGGSNRKLFLDRLTISQAADASVEAITADERKAWVSGPREITLNGQHARVYDTAGRCVYEGGAAATTLTVEQAVVIAEVDGVIMKLKL